MVNWWNETTKNYKKKTEHNRFWKYINFSSTIARTEPLKLNDVPPNRLCYLYNVLKQFFSKYFTCWFFPQINLSVIKIKILNLTALYSYTHNLATMFVCESASETGLCQVLHTKRALAIAGRVAPLLKFEFAALRPSEISKSHGGYSGRKLHIWTTNGKRARVTLNFSALHLNYCAR